MVKNDGGPAFPSKGKAEHGNESDYYNGSYSIEMVGGMSLRDWFAGMALMFYPHEGPFEAVACDCYKMADAMIAERDKE